MIKNSPGSHYKYDAPVARFRLRGIRYFRYLAVVSILAVPAILFLDRFLRFRIVDLYGLGAVLMVGIVILGFLSQFGSNMAIMDRHTLTLKFRSHTTSIAIADILSISRIYHEDELDLVDLPDDHVPIEFDTEWQSAVLLIMKKGSISESPGKVFDGLLVGYVTVSPVKPQAFIHALQARM